MGSFNNNITVFSCRISPNLKSIVYCNAIQNGGIKEWDFAFERYQKANVASEKIKLLGAMACSGETWILSRYEKIFSCIESLFPTSYSKFCKSSEERFVKFFCIFSLFTQFPISYNKMLYLVVLFFKKGILAVQLC